jgi:2-haloacid dehalogenase
MTASDVTPPHATTPEAVVFDLGNVLIRWDPHPAIAAGVGPDEATRFLSADDFDFAAWNHAQDAGRLWDDAERAAVASHPHWREHLLAYRPNFAHSLLGPIDGTVRLVEELHAAGIPLFALTNWSAELFHHARDRFGFLDLFADIVVSGDERLAKPAPEIFARLADRVRRPLGRCLFVDDSPANVQAARDSGLPAVRFTDPDRLRAELRRQGLPVTP